MEKYLFGEDADLYRRTLRLLFSLACEKIFPDRSIQGGYSIANAYWYWIQGIEAVHHNELEMIKAEMLQLVARDVKVHEEKRPYKEVLQYFIEKEQFIAAKLLSSRIPIGGMVDVKVCMIEEKPHFRLRYPKGGVMLTYGSRFVDQPAITSAILELREWSKKTGVNCSAGDGAQKLYIHACEVRLENKISELAKQIAKRAGPTASGKTTFSHKLSLALRTEGVSSMPLTVDHYYLPLDRQPKYQIRHNRADVDYDSIESMDVELVQEHIMALTHGETAAQQGRAVHRQVQVMTPIYNMKTGYREHPGKEMKLEEGGTLIIEGIHALNPNYTSKIPENEKFKVYISPIMTLQLDDFNVCKTTDHRLARRMSRDYLFRGNNAAKNEADFIFNSAMHCELPILKGRLDQLLRTVPPDNDNFVKCSHLLAVLDTFPTWQESPVASTSILREFIGGAICRYASKLMIPSSGSSGGGGALVEVIAALRRYKTNVNLQEKVEQRARDLSLTLSLQGLMAISSCLIEATSELDPSTAQVTCEIVLDSLKCHADVARVQRGGLLALSGIFSGRGSELKPYFANRSLLACLDAMQRFRGEMSVLSVGCLALWSILMDMKQSPGDGSTSKEVVRALLSVLEFSPNHQDSHVTALSAISQCVHSASYADVTRDDMEVILSSIDKSISEERVADQGLRTLLSLLGHDLLRPQQNLRVSLGARELAEIVAIVSRALQAHQSRRSIVESSSLILWLLGGKSKQSRVSDEAILILFNGLLEDHPLTLEIVLALSASLTYSTIEQCERLQWSHVSQVVEVLERSSDALLLQHALMLLSNLMSRQTFNQHMSLQGATGKVVRRMRGMEHSRELDREKCALLGNLAVTEENRRMIAESEGIELIFDCVAAFLECPDVQEKGSTALLNLAVQDQYKEVVTRMGGIEYALETMSRHPGEILLLERVCGLLGNLGLKRENQREILSKGGVIAILSSMKRHPQASGLQCNACGAIWSLVSNQEVQENQRVIGSSGGIPVILHAMACGALCGLVFRNDKNRSSVKGKGGVELLKKALQTHSRHQGVTQTATFCLEELL
ncbi:hypothetical protein GUITHDRAFT_136260 [Guillardia theta CCMP2712]|uniref:Phosphoribulokinase/uridine kinase domain-containing protein n=1 Tax=Guillardia theta (strain CCMP2712) TaxID=905079 RepID=L1JL57_GUITC|nr:hypothetical protein GUITHDRAFT_136260 [Guillardia theta CCMP2712]EKX49082.1 hypothetical protein GUITHDRAFT_136260 [Guillardia theta CCMP2712]|eukprot:XP_005836062.1 hypothetical protein GUITHDRAFT_136260 [Guillardia theta CCMP2712]